MRRRSILTSLLVGAVWLVTPLAPAIAQGGFPREIVSKTTLTPEDKALIEAVLKEHMPNLANTDPVVMKKSRDELLTPFKDHSISVAFRQAYTEKSIAELRKLVGQPQDVVVVNALRIAGELATSDATTLLEQKLGDAKVAVRFAAVNGLERTMAALAGRAPAIPAQRIEQLVDRLGAVILDPQNSPEVVDAGVRALMAAIQVNIGTIRPLAFRTLCGSVGKVAQRSGPVATPLAMQKMFLRTGEAVRNALGNAQVPLAGDSVKDAAALSGHLLSWSFCQVKAGLLPTKADRESPSQIVKVAETTIVLACTKAGALAPQKLGEDFEKADAAGDNAFIRNLSTKIIPAITGPPFNLPNADFLNCKPPPG